MKVVTAVLDRLRSDKYNYRAAFGPGTPGEAALIQLGRYCRAFDNSVTDHDGALIALGLRRAYFHIVRQLQFEPEEIDRLYRPVTLGE